MINKTPWSNKQAQEDRNAEMAKSQVFLAALAKAAQECLTDPKFATYKAQFIEYEKHTVEHIINLNETEPVIYAFKVRQLVDTLKAYRLLISSVEQDAQRKVE